MPNVYALLKAEPGKKGDLLKALTKFSPDGPNVVGAIDAHSAIKQFLHENSIVFDFHIQL